MLLDKQCALVHYATKEDCDRAIQTLDVCPLRDDVTGYRVVIYNHIQSAGQAHGQLTLLPVIFKLFWL